MSLQFKKKGKAHRMKFHNPTTAEVETRFNAELEERIVNHLDGLPGGLGVNIYHRHQVQAYETLELMKEWEAKGRKTAFIKTPYMQLLEDAYKGQLIMDESIRNTVSLLVSSGVFDRPPDESGERTDTSI